MKKLHLSLLTLVSALFILASCNKDDFDYAASQKEQQRLDSIENARVEGLIASQAPALKTFVDANMPGATLVDSLGIWFIVDAPGEENSYTYTINSFGQILAPTVEVKYKGTLLNGDVFDKTEEGKFAEFTLGGNLIRAWQIAFLPKSITLNGNTFPITGLTNTGLKKGSKIRFVTSSPYAYDRAEVKDPKTNAIKIPANSPLYFEIEVSEIK